MTTSDDSAPNPPTRSDLAAEYPTIAVGAPVRTIRFSALVESRAALAAGSAALANDPACQSLVAKAADWVVAPPTDSLRRLLTAPPEGMEPPPIGVAVSGIMAVAAGGQGMEALEFGVELAGYLTQLTGALFLQGSAVRILSTRVA